MATNHSEMGLRLPKRKSEQMLLLTFNRPILFHHLIDEQRERVVLQRPVALEIAM